MTPTLTLTLALTLTLKDVQLPCCEGWHDPNPNPNPNSNPEGCPVAMLYLDGTLPGYPKEPSN